MEYDLSFLKKLAGDDKHFILDMLLTFKRTSPPIIKRMIEYEAAGKYEALGREAHKLIPGVSFVGATKLKDELIKIEEGAKMGGNRENIHDYVLNTSKYVEELILMFDKDFNLDQHI